MLSNEEVNKQVAEIERLRAAINKAADKSIADIRAQADRRGKRPELIGKVMRIEPETKHYLNWLRSVK